MSESQALASRGILYPTAGRVAAGGHLNLCWEAVGDARFQVSRGGIDDLLVEIRHARATTVVLSAETLTTRPGRPVFVDWADRLCEQLRPDVVQVIGYVRPQWSYIESLYTQQVKMGYTSLEFGPFVESIRTHPRFDYNEVFAPWKGRFGRSLLVRPYGESMLFAGDVVLDFWAAAELGSAPGSANQDRSNVRTGAMATELLRLLGWMLDELGVVRGAERQALFQWAATRFSTAIPEDVAYRGMPYELAHDIHRQFEDSNDRFGADYLSPDERTVFDLPVGEAWGPVRTWRMDTATTQERLMGVTALRDSFKVLGSLMDDRDRVDAIQEPPSVDDEANSTTLAQR